jgi:hypothetical protein
MSHTPMTLCHEYLMMINTNDRFFHVMRLLAASKAGYFTSFLILNLDISWDKSSNITVVFSNYLFIINTYK